MVLYHGIAQMRAGATPQTFDGSQTITFNEKAARLVALCVSMSQSVRTTDEGVGMGVKLSSSNWQGDRYFPAGYLQPVGPATNAAYKAFKSTIIPLDIEVGGNTTVEVNISTVIGATQTGTLDVTIDLIYDDGETPGDIIDAIRLAPNSMIPIAIKGGNYLYLANLAVTARTAFSNNNSAAGNIPAEAEELVGCIAGAVPDTALTADQEATGYLDYEFGISEGVDQKALLSGSIPGDGTEVDGNEPADWAYTPMYLRMPDREVQVRGFVNLYGAVTGGLSLAAFLLWR